MLASSDETNQDVWLKQDGSPESPASFVHPADSNSALLGHDAVISQSRNAINEADERPVIASIPMWKRYAGVAILFFINLLNYMDRFTIAGVLMDITNSFMIDNAMAGLLQTVFIISYMVFAPLFGYLGDRYNRKVIMVVGMLVWSGFTFLSSFIQKPEQFPLFVITRALVGIGEASYATIAPTLIGDMFVGPKRTRMLSVFFFATPIGSGLGYIVGSKVALALGGWQWALRITPGLGVVAVVLLWLFCPNPVRGASEASGDVDTENKHSYRDDLCYIARNKSFIYVTIGFTFMAFVMGSLTLWGPTYFAYSQIVTGVLDPCQKDNCYYVNINLIFGVITCVGGFAGVGIGAEAARWWKRRGREDADALVCAIGHLVGAPLLFFALLIAQLNINAAWVLVFFADLSLCVTWTLISDMTLYVTEPSRRSTANAVQLLIGHLFGDAGSPYLLGVVADSLAAGGPDTYVTKYIAYQYSMFIALFACVLGGAGFLLASLYIIEDKRKVEDFLKGSESTSSGGNTSSSEHIDQRTNGSTIVPGKTAHPGNSKRYKSGSDGQTDHLLTEGGSIM